MDGEVRVVYPQRAFSMLPGERHRSRRVLACLAESGASSAV